jgi:hypothetical protein
MLLGKVTRYRSILSQNVTSYSSIQNITIKLQLLKIVPIPCNFVTC